MECLIEFKVCDVLIHGRQNQNAEHFIRFTPRISCLTNQPMFLTSRERRCLSCPQIQLITAQTTAACRTWWTVSGKIARCYCELWNHISNACLLISAQEVHWAMQRDTKSSATSGSALGLMLPSAPCCESRTDPASSRCCLWEMFALNSVSFFINRLNVCKRYNNRVLITHKVSRM